MADYQTPPVASHYEDPRDHAGNAVRDFLRKISFLESSYGQNTDHATMQSGPHIGTHAIGEYGLMPLTAQQIDKTSGAKQLQDMDKFDVQAKLEMNPELQKRLAETMASKLLAKNPSDVAAYKWEQGQNRSPSQEDLDGSTRVRRFKALQNVR